LLQVPHQTSKELTTTVFPEVFALSKISSEKLVFFSTAFADKQTNKNKEINNFFITNCNIFLLLLAVQNSSVKQNHV
jgi:hypothetical protein